MPFLENPETSDSCLSPLDVTFLQLDRQEYALTWYAVRAERSIPSPPPTPRPRPMDLPPDINEGSALRIFPLQLHPILDIHTVFSRQLEVIDLRNPGAMDLIDPKILCSVATNPPVNRIVIMHDYLAEKVAISAELEVLLRFSVSNGRTPA